MKKKGECVFCNGVVASGGDRHKGAGTSESCCSRRGIFGEHRRTTKKRKKFAKRHGGGLPQRGMAVAGTGKPAASASKTKAKAKTKQA